MGLLGERSRPIAVEMIGVGVSLARFTAPEGYTATQTFIPRSLPSCLHEGKRRGICFSARRHQPASAGGCHRHLGGHERAGRDALAQRTRLCPPPAGGHPQRDRSVDYVASSLDEAAEIILKYTQSASPPGEPADSKPADEKKPAVEPEKKPAETKTTKDEKKEPSQQPSASVAPPTPPAPRGAARGRHRAGEHRTQPAQQHAQTRMRGERDDEGHELLEYECAIPPQAVHGP